MEKEIKLTVAISIFNAEKDLFVAVQSVLNQTFKDFKLLLINDGSTDSSMDIVRSINDPRITILDDGLNLGLAKRLNQITRITDTKYLGRMDADDVISLDKFEKQMAILENDESIDLLGTNAFSVSKKDLIQGSRFFVEEGKIISTNFLIHATIIGKTEWFRNNEYDENLYRMQDTELWYRTYKFSNFKTLLTPLYYYREESGNYYRKYFKSIKLFWYVAKKNNFNWHWLKQFIKICLVSTIYYVLNIIGREDIVLRRRNKAISEKKLNIYQKDYNSLLEKVRDEK